MRKLVNGFGLVLAGNSPRDRAGTAVILGRYAIEQAINRGSGSFVATLRVHGLTLTLDLAAAEHVPVREIIARREYAPDERWLPGPGEVVVDAGANAGVFALDAASRVGSAGRVLAIEPNPAVVGRLLANVRQNGFADRITVIPVGLGASPGFADLVQPGRNSTIASIQPPTPRIGPLRVPVVSLDTAVMALGIEAIDLLKIDVEGSEAAVLEGARLALRFTKRVVLETTTDHRDTVLERLSAAGFDELWEREAGPDSRALLVYCRHRE